MIKGVCPLCGNTMFTVSKSESTFQFIGNRTCQVCSTVWIPPCPKWGAITAIIAGAIAAIVGNCAVFAAFPAIESELLSRFSEAPLRYPVIPYLLIAFIWVFILISCNILTLSPIIYGIRVLTGKSGKLQIIKKGKLPGDAEEYKTVVAKPLRKQFGQIRWYHLVVGVFIPFLALPWGAVNILREKWRSGLVLLGLSIVWLAVFLALVAIVLSKID